MADAGFRFLDPPTPTEEVTRVLEVLAAGTYSPEVLEGTAIDLKEDASRRDRKSGNVQDGAPKPEHVAEQLAETTACFANTHGGGALIVGVNDKTGEIIGTDIDSDWLRSRLYELTGGKMGANVREAEVEGARILVIITPQAVEAVPFKGKYRHRQGDKCVEVPSSVLLQGRFAGAAADPSFLESTTRIDDISDHTMNRLRELAAAADSAKATLHAIEVVSRLGLRYGDTDCLNKAGEILLATREQPAIDYTYREVQGGPSRVRIDQPGRSLLEEVDAVEVEAARRNPATEIQTGFAIHQVRHIPERTLREAILNGVCHRDWVDPQPTTVEHIGTELRVTSPGGFIRDITPENIMIRSEPRYRTLMNAVRGLGLVEQEGVGIDRMFTDLIRIGADLPIIEALPRPAVRVVLRGRRPNRFWLRFFDLIRPTKGIDDADLALAVWMAANPNRPYLTAHSCQRTLQRKTLKETNNVLKRIRTTYEFDNGARIFVSMRTPPGTQSAWKLSARAKRLLQTRPPKDPLSPARAWVRERGRVSSSEYQELTGVSGPTAVKHLKELATAEGLHPSSPTGKGRGFHYILPKQTQT